MVEYRAVYHARQNLSEGHVPYQEERNFWDAEAHGGETEVALHRVCGAVKATFSDLHVHEEDVQETAIS
jgi:xanthine/CO dehydrogenase XdhC/CoxF family maturation factor